MICDSSTYLLGKVHDNRIMGIANKNTSANNSILFYRSKLRRKPFLILDCAFIVYMNTIPKT